MSSDPVFDPYEISVALRKAGVLPIGDPRQWTEEAMRPWPDAARRAVREVVADPAKLVASQLFVLDEKLLSDDLADLVGLAHRPVATGSDGGGWASAREPVLAALGAILYEAARQRAAFEDVSLPASADQAEPDVHEWLRLMVRPVAHAGDDVLPLFLSEP